MNTENNSSPFGPVIYSYTRKQAVADGVQVEVTKTAHEAGIRFPVFTTRGVFQLCVAVAPTQFGSVVTAQPLCATDANSKTPVKARINLSIVPSL